MLNNLEKKVSTNYGIKYDSHGLLCPFHNDKKSGSFHVSNTDKGFVYNCFSCGAKGGEYTLRINLAQKKNLVNEKQKELLFTKNKDLSDIEITARNELLREIGKEFADELITENLESVIINKVDRFNEDQVYNMNLIYKEILNILSLSTKDKKYLLSRSLTEEEILENGYKSLTKSKVNVQIEKIEKMLSSLLEHEVISSNDIYNIPGIYSKRDKNGKRHPSFKLPKLDGILIPIYFDSMLIALQIRNTTVNKNIPRYFWLSSVKEEDGTSSGSPIMSVDSIDKNKPYLLTEGHFKAIKLKKQGLDKKYNILSIQGIGNGKDLISILKDAKKLVIAFDIDIFDKDESGKVTRKPQILSWIKPVLKENKELKIIFLKWKETQYKGIDDLIIAKGSFDAIKEELNQNFLSIGDFINY